MNKGYLITLEGPEGGGKTTLIPRIVNWVNSLGLTCVNHREPGGTIVGEKIRDVLLNDKSLEMTPLTEALLFQAARSEIVNTVVRPDMEMGKIVLLDRYKDSSIVYQGLTRGLGVDTIMTLNKISTGGLEPNLTLLLDVDTKTGMERRSKASEGLNRIDLEKFEFHKRIRDAYLDIAQNDKSGRWVIIDANPEMEMVEKSLQRVIGEKLMGAGFIEREVSRERGF